MAPKPGRTWLLIPLLFVVTRESGAVCLATLQHLFLKVKPIPAAEWTSISDFPVPLIDSATGSKVEGARLFYRRRPIGPTETTDLVDIRIGVGEGDAVESLAIMDGSVRLDTRTFVFGEIRVSEPLRRQGIQEALLGFFVAKYPDIEKTTAVLSGTNTDAFADHLVRFVRQQPDYIGAAPAPDARTPINDVLEKCCMPYLNDYAQRDPDGFDRLLESATKTMPAYKTSKRIGFGKMCRRPALDVHQETPLQFTVSLEFCRD